MHHAFLIDLTKENEDLPQVVGVIREYAAPYNPVVMQWVARADQRQFLGSDMVQEAYPDLELPNRIRALVQHMSQNGAGGSTIHVLSFEGHVLAAVSTLNGPECSIVGHPIRPLLKNAGRTPIRPAWAESSAPRYHPPGAIAQTKTASGVSIQEAIALAKRVLIEGGHTSEMKSLRLTSLRPAMVFHDRRIVKDQYDNASRTLIRTIVDIGLRDGWLHRAMHPRSGTELIWIQQPNTGAATEVPLPAPAPPLPQSVQETTPPAEAQPAEEAQGTQSPASRVNEKYRESGRGQMEAILRQEEIGSPASARPPMFAAIRQILADNPEGLCGSDLWNKLAEITERTAEETSRLNWERTTECFLNMLFGAGVLYDAPDSKGQSIPLTFARWGAKVMSCDKDDLELRAEAYLAYRIIVRRGGIHSSRECLDLAFAIYQQGRETGPKTREIKIRTAALIDYLQQVLRLVDVSDDGKITPKPPPEQPAA